MWASVYRSATPGDAVNCFRAEGSACAGDANATLEDFQDWIQRTPENFLCSGQLIPDTTLSFSSARAGASPPLN